ncbi:hypothetical protein PQX77_003677 [Marasmius sp. AFHP31]|nr:hypothetical protein PQX77_003677 [Marasmius sp. AFHP31]
MTGRVLALVLASLQATIALAANYDVTVGANGKLSFHPEYVHAKVGDTVTFVFHPKNHTVTQSSFEQPCLKAPHGFDTGFKPVPVEQTSHLPREVLTVHDDTKPMWFYCQQKAGPAGPHCPAGMVFAVNPPPEENSRSFSAFKHLASKSNATSSTTTAYGSQPTSAVQPTNHKVTVGLGGLIFNPSNITAAVGDKVTFEFHPKAHGVTQSSFSSPCSPLANGFASGLMPVASVDADKPIFQITVYDTKPIWAYCPQQGPPAHCGEGMVFSVNAVEDGPNNFAAFQAIANRTKTMPTMATGSGGTTKGNVAAAIDDSDLVDLDVKQLITNSYIVIGLLAGILITMVVVGVMSTRGALRGRDSKPRYTVVVGKDTESLTAPSMRYSD